MRTLTFLLVWNVLLAGVLPSSAYALRTSRHPPNKLQGYNALRGQNKNGYIGITPFPQSRLSYNYKGLTQKPSGELFDMKLKNRCNGKEKLIEDIGSFAIISGGVGLVMGVFSASYISVLSSVISIISTFLSYAIGIPSAVITYLAAQDRLSYAVANFLSVLGIANTIYGQWSIDIGNMDMILGHLGNFIGGLSLVLSIISGYEDVFDSVIEGFRYFVGKQVVDEFVDGYRCDGRDFWGNMISFFD